MRRTLQVEESLVLSSTTAEPPVRSAPAICTRLIAVGVLAILLGVLTATTFAACYSAIVVPPSGVGCKVLVALADPDQPQHRADFFPQLAFLEHTQLGQPVILIGLWR